ncbi:hypothetical protein ACWDOP_01650 [Nocardia sp. NPDC003693]
MARNLTTTARTTTAARVDALWALAERDLQATRDATHGWFARLTRDFGPPETAAEIEELFALGIPPHPAGPSRGHREHHLPDGIDAAPVPPADDVDLARKTWLNGKGGYPLIAHWYETAEPSGMER